MILGYGHFHALAQIFHAELSDQFICDIASHRIDTVYLGRCQTCDDRHYLIGNFHFSNAVLFIYDMCASIFCFSRHSKSLLTTSMYARNLLFPQKTDARILPEIHFN